MDKDIQELKEKVDKLNHNLSAFRADRELMDSINTRLQKLELDLAAFKVQILEMLSEDV